MKRFIILLGFCIGVHFFVYGGTKNDTPESTSSKPPTSSLSPDTANKSKEDQQKEEIKYGDTVYSYTVLRKLIEEKNTDKLKKFAEDYKLPGYDAGKNNVEDAINRFINSGRRWRFTKETKWHQRDEIEGKSISKKTIENYKIYYIKESLDKLNDIQNYLKTNTTYYAENCSKPIEENDAEKWFLDAEKIKKHAEDNKNIENDNKKIIELIKRIPLDEKFDVCQKDFKDVVKKDSNGVPDEAKSKMINEFLIQCNDDVKKDLISLDKSDQDVDLTLRLPQIRKLRSHSIFLKNLDTYTKSLLAILGIDFTQGSGPKWKDGIVSADQIKKLKDNQYYQVLFNRLLKSLKVFGKDDDFNKIYEFLAKEKVIDEKAKYFSMIKNIKLLDQDHEENNENIFNHRLSALMGMRTGETGKEIKNEVHQLYKYERRNIRTAFRMANSVIGAGSENPYTIFKNLLLEMVKDKQLDSKSMYYALEAAKLNPNFKDAAKVDEENDKKKSKNNKNEKSEENDKGISSKLENVFKKPSFNEYVPIKEEGDVFDFLKGNELIVSCFNNQDDSEIEDIKLDEIYGIKKEDIKKDSKWEDVKKKLNAKGSLANFNSKLNICLKAKRTNKGGVNHSQLMSLLSYEMGTAFLDINKGTNKWNDFKEDSLAKLQFIAGTYDSGRDFDGQKKGDVGTKSIEQLKFELSGFGDREKDIYKKYGENELIEGDIPSLQSVIIHDVDLIGRSLLNSKKLNPLDLKLVKGDGWDSKKSELLLKTCLFKEKNNKEYTQLQDEWKKFDFKKISDEDKKILEKCAERFSIKREDLLKILNKSQDDLVMNKDKAYQLVDVLLKLFPQNDNEMFLFIAQNQIGNECFSNNEHDNNKLGDHSVLINYINNFKKENNVEDLKNETGIGTHFDEIKKQVKRCVSKQREIAQLWAIATKQIMPFVVKKEDGNEEGIFLLTLNEILKYKDNNKMLNDVKEVVKDKLFAKYMKIIEDVKGNLQLKEDDPDYLLKFTLVNIRGYPKIPEALKHITPNTNCISPS